jgi:hypothetical protein
MFHTWTVENLSYDFLIDYAKVISLEAASIDSTHAIAQVPKS